MKNKLLASILTACMLLTMLPTAAFAAETEAEPGTEQTATATEQSDPVTEDAGDQTEGTADGTDAGDAASGQTAENSVAKVGDKYYATLAEAIDVADSKTVTLIANVTENVTIPADTTVTLDLNGKCLTNKNDHTIINYGTLTIQDSVGGGVVDVVTHGKAALCNKGTINEISGGTFTRSKEAGTAKDGNGNSWYTVYNAGTIEKITGGTFENKGTFSSMLINGWNNPGPAVQGYIGTISGGTFTGGVITIKNDDGGHIGKICGDAVITNATQTAIQNTSIIGEISGGTIKGGALAIYNSSWKDEKANEYIGTITIKDGAVIEGGIDNTNWGGDSNTVAQFAKTTIEGGKISGSLKDDNLGSSGCQIVISGGTFSSDPSDYCATGYTATKNESGQWVVSPKEGMEADTSVSGNTASAEVGGTFSGNEDLGQDNVGASNGTLSIDATVTEGDTAAITKTEVSIGNEALTSVSGANSVNSVVLKTNVADLTVDKAAWNAITKNADGAKVALTIEEKAGTGGAPLTYTVTATANGKDVYSADNATGSIKISVKYEGTDLPKVYYVGPNGLEDMKAELKDGILSWTAKHFSDYVVVSGEQKILVKESDGSLEYYGTLTDAITNAGENAVITLLADIPDAVGISVPSGKKFVLDFNQHTYTLTGPGAGSPNTESNAFQLLKDSTITFKNGTIRIAEGANNIKRIIQNYADLTLENMQIYAANQVGGEDYALSFNNGNIVFKGNTSVITSNDNVIAFDVCKFSSYPGVTVTFDETYTGTINGKIVYDSPNAKTHQLIVKPNQGTLGAIESSSTSGAADAAENGGITVSGGSFTAPVDPEYLADGLNFEAKDSNGIYTYHSKVEDALDAAGSDGTVSSTEENSELEITLPTPTKEGYTFLYWEAKDGTQYKGGQKVKASVFQDLTAVWEKNTPVEPDRPSGDSSDNERTYAIITEDDGNGSVTVSADEASAGTRITVTVKPDAGYELDELTVTDAKNKDLKLTKRSESTYTFHMADSKVTVEVSFARDGEAEKPGSLFDDVSANAYYADAVKWAVEQGITSGTSATTFSPDMSCTRAQIVTFLWRANGSPKADGANPFTDVSADAYYYDAVLWAVKEGITSGTTAATFSPDATVTRGQTVTFLYRAAGAPAVTGGSFADVAADAYYAGAVAWAVKEGVTSGTSATTFSPDAPCTRGQIVTFLYHAQ